MVIMAVCIFLYSVPGAEGTINVWLTFTTEWFFFIGFGIYMPSITSLFAKFTTVGERGKIIGCGSVFFSAADIIGPIVFGILYEEDVNLVWYVASAGVLVGLFLFRIIQICINIRLRKIQNQPKLSVCTEFDREEDWRWEKDKEYTDEDYLLLGKRVGKILSFKNWRWVMKIENVEEIVEYSFPHIPEEVLTSRKKWNDFWSYDTQIWGELKPIYCKRDEDYMFAQSNGWDFSVVNHIPVDLSFVHKQHRWKFCIFS